MRQFIADASHELRTPLTTIRGFAELYRQGAAREPEQTARLLRRIEDEASRMGLLVEDLLLLARLDRERPLKRWRRWSCRCSPPTSVEAARAVAPERRIELEIEPGSGAAGGARRRRPAAPGDRQPDDQRADPHPAGGVGDAAAAPRGREPRRGGGGRHRPGAHPGAGRAGLRALLPGRRGAYPVGPAATSTGLGLAIVAASSPRTAARSRWTGRPAAEPRSGSGCRCVDPRADRAAERGDIQIHRFPQARSKARSQ